MILPADSGAPREHDASEDFLTAVRATIDDRIAQIRQVAEAAGGEAATLPELIAVLMTGGKRLRALLAYSAWQAHASPDQPTDSIIELGAALELVQAAALLHDDIIDRSALRRGQPTAHETLRAAHEAGGWTGDSEHYGIAGGILTGDLALIAADASAADCAAALAATGSARGGADFRAAWREMALGVTAGQFLDLHAGSRSDWGLDPAADEARARNVLIAKSARYSVEFPVVLGALLAGATPEEAHRLARFGLPLGIAFQLRDDLLGVFGDPALTGKPVGDDIREGKRTILLARTSAGLDSTDRDRLRAVLSGEAIGDAQVTWVTDLMVRTGAVADVEAQIELAYRQAIQSLDECSLAPAATDRLRGLADRLVARER